MKTTVEKRPKNQVFLRIELEPASVEADIKSAVSRLSSSASFPGFRPGKAPYGVVAKKFGEQAILEEALENIVRRTYAAAVLENKLSTIGQPKIDVEKVAPGNPVVYTALVALLPDVTLPALNSLKIEHTHVSVTDDDVAKSLEELRTMMAKENPVDRPAKHGDRVELDFDVVVDGVAVDGGTSRNHPAILGEENFVPGFEEQVTGMTKEQIKEFQLTFPKDYHVKHLAGKTADFKVTVKAVAERELPELNDRFAKEAANLDTLAALRERMKNDLMAGRQKREERDYEVKLLAELVKRSAFGEIPDMLVDNEVERIIHELKHDVEQREMKWPDYLQGMKKDETTLRREVRPNAEQRVKTALAIRAITDSEKITVADDEIIQEINRLRQTMTDEKQIASLRSDDGRDYIRSVLLNRKAIDAVKKNIESVQ
ncbi:MAG: trigger factor [Candidatus Kerfeldbacteria bacterium]|nr:trigger factor [Candidatus Kerfeldbacteria bacterium]